MQQPEVRSTMTPLGVPNLILVTNRESKRQAPASNQGIRHCQHACGGGLATGDQQKAYNMCVSWSVMVVVVGSLWLVVVVVLRGVVVCGTSHLRLCRS